MKIDFKEKFDSLNNESDILKSIDTNNEIEIYYGLTDINKKRLMFTSKNKAPYIDSTKMISVNEYYNQELNCYHICFDLENNSLSNLFYTFCEDIINSIELIHDEIKEIKMIIERFYNWKIMFQKISNTDISEELEQGVFGELYFLNNYMIPKYGIDIAINSWTGPFKYNKDFSVNDTWYEIKTSSVSSNVVEITSLEQLESEFYGYLSIIKIEKMSNEFTNGQSSIVELFSIIMSQIKNNELQEQFLKRFAELKINIEDDIKARKYDVKDILLFIVNDDFPRLTRKKIQNQEIENVSYLLNINSLERYKVIKNV